MSEHRHKPIPESKQALVKQLSEDMKNARTILVASCKGLPGQQYHDIKKKLRSKASIRVARKSAVMRAIEATKKPALQNLKEQYGADCALFLSDVDPFELSGLLTDNQSATKAKTGDIAPYEIAIEPGPTDLVPGPAISELGAVGLKVAVKEGKLEIQNRAVVAKEGAVITDKVAGVLGKLGVSPMKVGFLPLAAYDSQDDKTYVGIRIDKAGAYEQLKEMISKALGFATKVGYVVKENVSYFISKAAQEEKALQALVGGKENAPVAAEEQPAAVQEETTAEAAQEVSTDSESTTKEDA